MIQEELILSRNNDPITSYESEEKVKRKGTVERELNAILKAITANPLHTCGELSHINSICDYSQEKSYQVYQKRVSILENRNKIKRCGKRKCSKMGTNQTVWDVV